MDVQNVQIVARRSKLGLLGSRTCTKHIRTPKTAELLWQRSNKKKKDSRTVPWMNSLQPNSNVSLAGMSDLEGLRHMEVEPTGRSKRKRQAFAIGDLRTCICGKTADPQFDNVIPCKQMGCESKWVSFYIIEMKCLPPALVPSCMCGT